MFTWMGSPLVVYVQALTSPNSGRAAVGFMTSQLIFSLYYRSHVPPIQEGVGEGVRGVVWIWVIVGVVGVCSQWVGGGDPLEN